MTTFFVHLCHLAIVRHLIRDSTLLSHKINHLACRANPRLFRAAWLATLAILLISCKDQGWEIPTGGPLLPLSSGNFWKYQTFSALASTTADTLVLKVDGEVFIERHGKSYSGFSVRWYFPGDVPDDFALVYQNRNYGLYIVAGTSKNDTLVMAAPYLKLSALPGEQWEVPVISYDRVTGTFSMTQSKLIDCVSTNAQYSTPAGDFTCIEFHWRERPEPDVSEIWDHYSYWAPGVGLVGEVVISSANNRINYRSVLCDFTIL